MSRPINITDDLSGGGVTHGSSEEGSDGQISGGELIVGVDGELVDSHFVGLAVVGVVLLHLEGVLFEDESSERFHFGGPVDSELALPLLEEVLLSLLGGLVNGEDGNGHQCGND